MKTLILFLDAISFSDFNEKNCPFLYKLAKEEVYGPLEIIPAGHHTEYTMLSGCLPIKHGLWTWYYLKENSSFSKIKHIWPLIKILEKLKQDELKRKIIDIYINLIRLLQGKTRFLSVNKIPINLIKKFEISVDKSCVDHNPLSVPTLFDSLRKNKKKYVAMDYPTISNHKRTWFFTGKDDFKQLKKIKKLLKNYPLVFAHVWKLDAIEHEFGLHSKQALEHIKKLDDSIKKIVLSQKEKIRLIIFSDHGGCSMKKTQNIQKIFKRYEGDYFIASTSAHMWLKKPDEKTKEQLKKELKENGYLVYDKTNMEKELKFPYKREVAGDISAFAKPHEQFYPDFFRDTSKVKSMHGYTKKVPELDGIFLMNGFGLKKKKIKDMKLYDITPTILKAMGMKIPEICDGKAKI